MPHVAWLVIMPALRKAISLGLLGDWSPGPKRHNKKGAYMATASTTATDVIAEDRAKKKDLEKTANTARKQMQARFTELLAEAASIQADFRNDFGANPDLPVAVRTFTITGKKIQLTEAEQNGRKVGKLRRGLTAALKHRETARVLEVTGQLKALWIDVAIDVAPAQAAAEEEEDLIKRTPDGQPIAADDDEDDRHLYTPDGF
jgi:hypothetical protein